jgi:MFS family permease
MAKTTRQRWSGLSTWQLMVTILFVAIFAMAVRPPTDTDTWWHLKSGELMWETGKLLWADSFSHTVLGQPWINHGWLVQILLWPVWQGFGLSGLSLLLATVVTATFALVYVQCEGRPYVAALAILLGAVASSVIWAVRPQMVSLLLTAAVTFLLHRYKTSGNGRWLWPIPFLVVVWVNSHGGFVIAFLLLGAYLAGAWLNRAIPRSATAYPVRLKPLSLILLASLPAVLLNPNTVKMIPYALQTVSIGPLQEFILEWGAPDFHNLQFHPFIWLLLLTTVAMGLSRRRADWTDLLLVSLFGYMSLLAARNVALFAVIAPPVLTRHAVVAMDDLATYPRLSWLAALTHTLRPVRPRKPVALLNATLLVLILAGATTKVVIDLVRLQEPEVWGKGLPLGAAEFLRGHDLPGEMFNTYNWGGYLIWSLYPDKPVFVDGRTDLYAFNSEVLQDYAQVHWVRPGWPETLERYGVGHVITERTGLLDVMLAETGTWEVVYQDEVAVIYARETVAP